MKNEWKKHEKDYYGAKTQPRIVTVLPQNFIMIKGCGNPNHPDFTQRVSVLYSLAYPIKMRFKAMRRNVSNQCIPNDYDDYTVYPLEGVWSTTNSDNLLNKDGFQYTIMIRQPDAITKEQFAEALDLVKKKKPHPFLNEITFEPMTDGKCVQMLHKGSFDDEPATFAQMDAYVEANGYKRLHPHHREIYLNDARKTKPENRQTILSYQIQ